jgi:hypothetical protein
MSAATHQLRSGRWYRPLFIAAPVPVSTWVRTRRSDLATLSEKVAAVSSHAAAIIGDNGIARLNEFQSYREGWDFGEGRALSLNSLRRMEWFLARYSSFPSPPSLFLMRSGNLALGWEDESDCAIEVEFVAGGFHVFYESTDQEVFYSVTELPAFLETLSASAHGAS